MYVLFFLCLQIWNDHKKIQSITEESLKQHGRIYEDSK